MLTKPTNKYPFVVLLFAIVLCYFNFMKPPVDALSWDVFGYYLYLPAKFIYHDLAVHDRTWLDALLVKYNPTGTLYQASPLENGNYVFKYSMGCAVMYAPFFFIAHLLAEPLGYPADGLSLPYQSALIFGGIIYALIGLYFAGKVLRMFFTDRITSLLLLIIFFSTNYFQLTAFTGVLASHNFLFSLYAMLLYYTIRWHQSHKLWQAVVIGFIIGIVTLIRPTEVVCSLIPLLWGVKDKASFFAKWQVIKQYKLHVAALVGATVLMGLPQVLYWKVITGHYLFYTYNNPGEGLEFLSPYTYKFLFSFRKGWFIYTPVMLLAMGGFYYLYKYKRELFVPIFIFFLIELYIISSWSNWWYAGGSYSSRAMMPAYVVLAFPLGYLLYKVSSSSKLIKGLLASVILLLTVLNLFQTWQFQMGILDGERMTRPYYFAVFGKMQVTDEDRKLLLVNRIYSGEEHLTNESDYTQKILYKNTFDAEVDSASGEKGALVMTEKNQYSPGINLKYKDITRHNHAWLRIKTNVFIPEGFVENPPVLVSSFHHLSLRKNEKAYKYVTKTPKPAELKVGEWNAYALDYLTPEVRSKEDNLKIYFWYAGKQPIKIDDFTIELFEPKVEYE